ncbi:hypothetical protein C8F04DRAFT_1234239 [Mycena alexandri]|uniref:Uncharacterized protein n=1 Tax=Mycena alexandri TaxID=1745969 RepID=A0AAD6SYI9_9AGAR|nr:hypothetical protein C8F04DRAFT_1234239 [Mycena alexandri]
MAYSPFEVPKRAALACMHVRLSGESMHALQNERIGSSTAYCTCNSLPTTPDTPQFNALPAAWSIDGDANTQFWLESIPIPGYVDGSTGMLEHDNLYLANLSPPADVGSLDYSYNINASWSASWSVFDSRACNCVFSTLKARRQEVLDLWISHMVMRSMGDGCDFCVDSTDSFEDKFIFEELGDTPLILFGLFGTIYHP